KAAELGPDPALAVRLRDAAVEFLMLRGVEARPGFATGATRGLVFAAEGSRLAAVAEDGGELSLWDGGGGHLLARPRLCTARAGNGCPRFPRGLRRGRGPFAGGPYLAAVGQGLATIRRNGGSLRLFDAVTGEFVRDVRATDRLLFRALYATPDGHRLVTIEQ